MDYYCECKQCFVDDDEFCDFLENHAKCRICKEDLEKLCRKCFFERYPSFEKFMCTGCKNFHGCPKLIMFDSNFKRIN